jgi:hypothetical protein
MASRSGAEIVVTVSTHSPLSFDAYNLPIVIRDEEEPSEETNESSRDGVLPRARGNEAALVCAALLGCVQKTCSSLVTVADAILICLKKPQQIRPWTKKINDYTRNCPHTEITRKKKQAECEGDCELVAFRFPAFATI